MPLTGRSVPVARSARSAAALLLATAVALLGGGCAEDDQAGFDPGTWDSPGQNAKVGPVLIRYAHVAEPRDGPWQRGDDVPAYVWLFNEGPEAARLVGAQSPAAGSVEIVDAGGSPVSDGVRLRPKRLEQLEPGRTHLALRDVNRLVRGGDFLKLTLLFEKAGRVTLQVQAQPPVYDGTGSPSPDA